MKTTFLPLFGSLELALFLAAIQTTAATQPGESPATPLPSTQARWTNSLGMVLARVPDTKVKFCLWETRVRDFAAFVQAAEYQAESTHPNFSPGARTRPDWRNPGFAQGLDHPVVMVTWNDAREFCAWLTLRERKAGLLSQAQQYRLPTDAEWSKAVGEGKYPWNHLAPTRPEKTTNAPTQWAADDRRFFPPPQGAGNYAGGEAVDLLKPDRIATLRQYEDGFPRTAPAGSFSPNPLGLYDMGGNVWEWCDDWYRRSLLNPELEQRLPFNVQDGGGAKYKVLRGASWLDSHPGLLRSDCRAFDFPDHANDIIGFRVVLETAP